MKLFIIMSGILLSGSIAAAQYDQSFSEFDPKIGTAESPSAKVDLPSPDEVQLTPPPPEIADADDHAFTSEDNYKDNEQVKDDEIDRPKTKTKPKVAHHQKKVAKKVAVKSSKKTKKSKEQKTASHKSKSSSRKLASVNKKLKRNKKDICNVEKNG